MDDLEVNSGITLAAPFMVWAAPASPPLLITMIITTPFPSDTIPLLHLWLKTKTDFFIFPYSFHLVNAFQNPPSQTSTTKISGSFLLPPLPNPSNSSISQMDFFTPKNQLPEPKPASPFGDFLANQNLTGKFLPQNFRQWKRRHRFFERQRLSRSLFRSNCVRLIWQKFCVIIRTDCASALGLFSGD